MNFVIFSMGFLPHRGAESWCTSRFAGALSQCGHNVHVVTMDYSGEVPNEVRNLVIGANVKITRITAHHVQKPIVARARYLTYEWDAIDYGACIDAVKAALREMPDAVLVTRSNPLSSAIIGWHCRKLAKKWVAHLSDPIPIPGREEDWRCLHGYVNRFWMRRTLRDADVISVTCPNAIRAYRDAYGNLAAKARFIVTPHIGEPVLSMECRKKAVSQGIVRIVHHGVMCAGRGAPELAEAVKALNANGVQCEFVQCGQVDDVADVFDDNPNVYCAEKCAADIEYIPDLIVPRPYCPFLSSKFVYRIFEDTPILLRTRRDSFSSMLADEYPDAGIVVATVDDDMCAKVREAIALISGNCKRDRLRECFTRQTVISNFVEGIK